LNCAKRSQPSKTGSKKQSHFAGNSDVWSITPRSGVGGIKPAAATKEVCDSRKQPAQKVPFPHIRLPFRGGPELSQAARSAPEGLGLDCEDRCGIVPVREGGLYLTARLAEAEGRALRGLWLPAARHQARRRARDRARRCLSLTKVRRPGRAFADCIRRHYR
jgi:hypothetical protein